MYIHILFHIFFYSGLSQDIGSSSLCCTLGSCCFFILYIIVSICESQTPKLSPSTRASLLAQMVKRLSAVLETLVRSLSREDPLEKEMTAHSSTLAWKIPWTEEPGRLQSMGLQSQTRLSNFTYPETTSLFSVSVSLFQVSSFVL